MFGDTKQDTRTEKKEPSLKPILCERCKGVNPATNRFCNRCGFVLDNLTAQEIIQKESEQKGADIMLNKLLNDKEIREILMRKLDLLKIEKP